MTFRVSPDVRWRVVDGEAVVVSQRSGEVLGLNETGARLLELIAGGADLADAVRTLADEFAAAPDEIEADATSLAHELVAAGVLVNA
jgi:hypothetical protein